MTNLQALYLSNTWNADTGLDHLKGLTSLRRIGLYKTEVTDVECDEL